MQPRFCFGLAAGLAISLATMANATLTGALLGSSPPPATLGGCALTPFPADPQPLFVDVPSVASPLGGVVGFSPPLSHRMVGSGWATWCHGYTGDVYYTAGATSVTLTMPLATTGFVFYAVPNPFDVFPFTVTGTTQSGQSVVLDAEADGFGGCAGFAYSTDDPCDPIVTISVSRLVDFAVGEFSICSAQCSGKGGNCVVVPGQCCFGQPAFKDPAYAGFAGPIAVMTASPDILPVPGSPTAKMVTVFDLSGTYTAALGVDFPAPRYSDPSWTETNLGSIFGVTLDASGNIYVTPTIIYTFADFTGIGGWGDIYKLDRLTGAITTFASPALPNASSVGLGNIVYDCANDQFFVTNFEDGKIYRLDSAGSTLSTFDHGAADSGAPGIAPLGERLWGITAHDGRVYYSVWNEDGSNPSASAANEVWSVALSGGDFSGAAQFELAAPPDPALIPNYFTYPISDLRFTPSGSLLIAERGMDGPSQSVAHESRLLEFLCSPAGWVLSPNTFEVGLPHAPSLVGTNTAGGVDVDFSTNGRYWATGDYLQFGGPDFIYGMQGLPPTGGTTVNSVLIDYNGNLTSFQDKRQLGDVAISCNAACMNVSNEKIFCPLEGTSSPCYTYSFDLTNKSGLTVQFLTVPLHPTTPSGSLIPGITINPNQINLLVQDGSLLDDGETTSVTLTICGGNPGDEFCVELGLVTPKPDFLECCFQEVCLELPECDCGQLSRQEFSEISCDPDGTTSFTYSFNLENLSDFAADQVIFIPVTGEQATFVKDFFFLPPLASGASLPMTVQIVGAEPGEEFCFSVLLQHPGSGEDCCCGFQKCITAPLCPEPLGCCTPTIPGGVGPCSMTTQADCDGTWAPAPASCFGGVCFNPFPVTCQGDLNFDGAINGLDLAMLLGQWTGASAYRPCPPNETADCNQDCLINGLDLGMMLGAWGPCK